MEASAEVALPDEASKRFAAKVRQVRQELGMSQFEFAIALGVTPRAVGWWEQAQGMPRVEQLQALMRVTGRSADWFLAE